MIKCALQHFAGDFGQTALSSLQLEGDLANAPNFRFYSRPQHRKLRPLLSAISVQVL